MTRDGRINRNSTVFTRKRAYAPGGDSLDRDDYDVESFGLITLNGFMELGEEMWLFFHGVVVSDLSTGPARIELKLGCYCHVPLKFFSSSHDAPCYQTRTI